MPVASPNWAAIVDETVAVPVSRTLGLISKTWLMISSTAMVSPKARPRLSMVPPMMPPLPNGRTTSRIMPHLVEPSANAASFSPGGVWLKT